MTGACWCACGPGRGSIARHSGFRAGTLALLLGLASAPRHVEAITYQVSVRPSGEAWSYLATDIGLAPGAVVSLDLASEPPANSTYILMLTHDQLRHLKFNKLISSNGNPRTLLLNSYLASHWRTDIRDRVKVSFQVRAASNERYYLGLLNVHLQHLRLQGNVSLVNPGGEELPLQYRHLPRVLLAMSALFTLSCALFLVLLARAWRRGRSPMHFLMLLVVLLKSCVLVLEGGSHLSIARTGQDNVICGIGWQLLDKVQTILELMMFLLLALGWKFVRSRLSVTEVRFALGMSIISFYLGIFEVVCSTPASCRGYRLSRYILHSLCYLVVIVAMNVNLQRLQHDIADTPASAQAGKLYQRLRAFRLFRGIFLFYVAAPTAELFLKLSTLPWDALWLYRLLQLVRVWALYVCVIMAFRPKAGPLRVLELMARGLPEDEEEASEEEAAAEVAAVGGPDSAGEE